MASPGSRHDVAALQPNTDNGATERSRVNGSSFSPQTSKPKSPTSDENESPSAASLLRLSGPVDPKLQSVLDWIESPPLQAISDWINFTLAPKQFEQLKNLDHLGYFCGQNLKYDYSEADEILAFRMAGAGHEVIVSRLRASISQGLKNSATQDEKSYSSREFALLPDCDRGSAPVWHWSSKVKGKMAERRPDVQFQSKPWGGPSLIIEVAWTQSTKNLQELACDYILGTNAGIRTVIGFDVDISAGKGATVSIWRAVCDEDNVAVACESTEIRSESGVKNSDRQAGLRLTLEDFAYDRKPEEYPDLDSVPIFIPVDDLYAILEQSEVAQKYWKAELESRTGERCPTTDETASHCYSLRSREARGFQK